MTNVLDEDSLEAAGTNSHEQQANSEASHGTIRIANDRWNSRNGENDVTDDIDEDGEVDCLITSKILIGDVGTKERSKVAPKLVDYIRKSAQIPFRTLLRRYLQVVRPKAAD